MKTYTVLTDIQGPEDHYGGMDLEVAGTQDKITAMQMDKNSKVFRIENDKRSSRKSKNC